MRNLARFGVENLEFVTDFTGIYAQGYSQSLIFHCLRDKPVESLGNWPDCRVLVDSGRVASETSLSRPGRVFFNTLLGMGYYGY
jgi:hypothetical protein